MEYDEGDRLMLTAFVLHALVNKVPWPPDNAVDPSQYAQVAVGMADAVITELQKPKAQKQAA
jgi:hypothetical protein